MELNTSAGNLTGNWTDLAPVGGPHQSDSSSGGYYGSGWGDDNDFPPFPQVTDGRAVQFWSSRARFLDWIPCSLPLLVSPPLRGPMHLQMPRSSWWLNWDSISSSLLTMITWEWQDLFTRFFQHPSHDIASDEAEAFLQHPAFHIPREHQVRHCGGAWDLACLDKHC